MVSCAAEMTVEHPRIMQTVCLQSKTQTVFHSVTKQTAQNRLHDKVYSFGMLMNVYYSWTYIPSSNASWCVL